ncbi:MAG: hypothetical protein CEE38_15400 [Planctomycetes bacterium B3_Pla]|nr:MAG: hypothetical protein CEE38_15400 [Planctomycetes bacterium B3_Pla]
MNAKKNIAGRPGVALLAVLFIVMTITILALGFLSQSDVELACGQNMVMRTQMDYLAESGLEHARGLILNPQDIGSAYWTGAVAQQLVAGSDDYYDVNVVKLPGERNYQITCDAYRLDAAVKTVRSSLGAELRLDPCIAYWAGASTAISSLVTVNGDVYCNGNLSGDGAIAGDAFASGSIIASNLTGQKNEVFPGTPVDFCGLDVNDFNSSYYINSTSYPVDIIDPNISNVTFVPGGGNPAGVLYSSGDPNNLVSFNGNVTINGMLVVAGDLTIRGTNNVITAVKNFPALLVSGELIIEDGATLQVTGLAQIGQRIAVTTGAQSMDIDGALFVANGGIDGSALSSIVIDITAVPSAAAIRTWPAAGVAKNWSQAAGASFRGIERN